MNELSETKMIQSDPVGYENGQNSAAEDGENLTHRGDRPTTASKMDGVHESDYNSEDENTVNNNVSKKSANDQTSDNEEGASPTKELFPNDQLSMQSFQSAIAQFTATAVANNMDNETVVKNLAVLQSALFTLQQQQFLQFQLIQHLQTELIKKNSEKPEPERPEPEETTKRDSRSRESAMDEPYERGVIRPREMEREPIQVKPIAKLTNQDEILTYQNSFPLATSNVITDHDDSPLSGESNSLAMLEKKAQEVLNSASQGILSNNLMDELAFTNDNTNSLARNDPALFKHRCRYCGKIFGSDSSLQIHVRSHTGERPYKCNICGSRFTTRGNLKVHFQRHADKYPHIPMNPNPVPEHLDKYFPPLMPHEAIKEGPSSPDHLPVHLQNPFPGIDPRQRDMIPEYFLPRPPSIDYMNNAKELHSPNPVDLSQMPQKVVEARAPSPVRTPSPQPVEIKAEPMDATPDTDDEEEHDDHPSLEPQTILTEGREEDYDDRCREASESARKITRGSVNNNLNEKSKAASVSPASHSSSNSGSLYQDTVLDPTYFPSHHMPRSESTDSSWENFIEITSDASKLQDLVDNIDDKATEPNQCLVCKKTLSCRSALQMHYRVHTGDRPFRCKICGRSFTTKGNLKTHMSVHRIKPPMRTLHQCPVCHQKFSNIFVLQQHIRLHTGEQTDLTPEQIRAAEIREFDSPFGVRGIPTELLNQKRKVEVSDDENGPRRREKSPKVPESPAKGRFNPVEQQAEDLRALHLQNLSVRSGSRDGFSRGSSPASQPPVELKRMRSSSPPVMPKTPPVLRNQVSPIATPPTSDHFPPGRPHLPYGNPFLGMPQFPPFMGQPSFMRNMPTMLPHAAAGLPQFGLFGVRGNTTTCNICYKTFACNSALDIHYRSHTKERPFKCTTCDRGFSTKGNMKQHLLTHKIRDGPGNPNSGDEESRQSSQSSQPEAVTAAGQQRHHNERSHHTMDDDDDDTDYTRGQYTMTKEADIKKWCNKLNEIPENIAAS